MHQFNGASTRYQSNFGEVHLYKGLHLCDTSQLTKAIGATKPTQRFAQSTFASSQLCSSEKNPPKDFTKHTCNMPVHIVNLYNDVFQSKPDPKPFVHCAHNKPKTTDQLGKTSNSFQVPYLLWASWFSFNFYYYKQCFLDISFFLIFSFVYVSLIHNITVCEYYYKRWQSCEIHCVECNMISHTYNTNNTHISWLDDINLHLPLHARWYLDWVKLDWHISWSFNCICVPI